ncbi:acyl-homoserine-lactone synthase [Rugamonas rubra]|jgi:N-acyl-L-homoserine lactone synthetase|uniref:Acyl-homoserine-lactone synthase n=1 Tax=Rugamonas rubra TaxID=758825 RepID=A0A1I4HTW2_9BURK|nr:acyl-homoserine-lactone synthase [Rugamonas rubra]SFL45474.1 N-acyl-L-homoserine lactone synthetase [Rugamonas rubra]
MMLKSIGFEEKGLLVRTVTSEDDKVAVYTLRHKVYCEHLCWVPASITGLEIDAYDQGAVHIGAFRKDGKLAATMRFISHDAPYMMEKEFLPVLPPGYRVRKGQDTAEVTRLATVVPLERDQASNKFVLDVIFKGMYAWSRANQIRQLYFVVELAMFRLMQARGFPVEAIAPARAVVRGGPMCLAVSLNWDLLDSQTSGAAKRRYVDWLCDVSREDADDLATIQSQEGFAVECMSGL